MIKTTDSVSLQVTSQPIIKYIIFWYQVEPPPHLLYLI